ncbi:MULTISPECIES: GNAT family N-acetyltransferase [unclassified Haladaptatus]|uniref:GNAT family N-acetyltransferase n=1 Tax=unclassified Haladaptatus TaxID=2622732 RepID=UPI00209C63DF|nr:MULTISPECIES: GNAT family N-acetyltransferase [unclassified Haladaptatus]MCO8246876.1 GNAT family N-acetyltransferase [Haladaptatus sp. AB643]MCO8253598.1 GNAT family N-acetyltransferase [Haladaptatus sp. AB618]
MSPDRRFPDEPAGPFPEPPQTFTDREGRDIEVRPFEEGDAEALVSMYVDFDPADRAQGIPPATEPRVRNWVETLTDGDGLNVIAWDGDEVAGHATLVPDGNSSYELAIFVHQEYQRAGIGSHLIRTLLGYGRQESIDKVWLTVERWNRAAVNLYRNVGFETADAESFELEMVLRL